MVSAETWFSPIDESKAVHSTLASISWVLYYGLVERNYLDPVKKCVDSGFRADARLTRHHFCYIDGWSDPSENLRDFAFSKTLTIDDVSIHSYKFNLALIGNFNAPYFQMVYQDGDSICAVCEETHIQKIQKKNPE